MESFELFEDDVSSVTSILALHKGEDPISYSSRVSRLTFRLPSFLRRQNHILKLLSRTSNPSSLLCAIHQPLNARLVRGVFMLVAEEVGRHVNLLLDHDEWLNPSQRDLLHKLRGLHSLWLSASSCTKSFLRSPSWRWQPDGCEACILSRIGGCEEVLLALRAVLLSRTRTKHPEKSRGPPRLLVFVESWIIGLCLSPEDLQATMARSDEAAVALKVIRKKIIKQGRTAQRRRSNAPSPDQMNTQPLDRNRQGSSSLQAYPGPLVLESSTFELNANAGSDIENEIIDHYAGLQSTVRLSSDYLLSTLLPLAVESHYSLDTVANNERVLTDGQPWPPRASVNVRNARAENQAQSYQALVPDNTLSLDHRNLGLLHTGTTAAQPGAPSGMEGRRQAGSEPRIGGHEHVDRSRYDEGARYLAGPLDH